AAKAQPCRRSIIQQPSRHASRLTQIPGAMQSAAAETTSLGAGSGRQNLIELEKPRPKTSAAHKGMTHCARLRVLGRSRRQPPWGASCKLPEGDLSLPLNNPDQKDRKIPRIPCPGSRADYRNFVSLL